MSSYPVSNELEISALRGEEKEQLLFEIRSDRAPPSVPAAEAVPLPGDLDGFWSGPTDALERAQHLAAKAIERALPAFPLWRGVEPLEATVDWIDAGAASSALTLLSACAAERADF